MSFMEKLFGRKSNRKPPSPQEAINQLKEVEEMLTKKTEFLEKKIVHELQTAKKAGTKNKRVALAALKRKRRYEAQLKQIDGTLSTIEFQIEAVEGANSNAEILKALRTTQQALKGANGSFDVDEVHDIMEGISEQTEIADEIGNALSSPVGFGQDYEEDDLTEELEGLEEEDMVSQLTSVENISALPSIPFTSIPASSFRAKSLDPQRADDDELNYLAEWGAA